MTSPHVIQFSPRFLPLLGGPEIDISTIVKRLTDYRFSVVSNALLGMPLLEKYRPNCEVRRVPPNDRFLSPSDGEEPWKWKLARSALAEVVRHRRKIDLIQKLSPDLVHVRDIDGWVLLRLDGLLRVRLCEFWAKVMATFDDLGFPLLLTKHFLHPPHQVPPNFVALEDFLMRQFRFIQCVDRHIYSATKEKMAGTDSRIWLTPVYADTDVFTPQRWENRKGMVVGYIGRYDPDKGTELLAEIIRRAPPSIRFEVALSGSARDIREFTSSAGKERVALHVNVPHDQLPAIIGKMDVLFNPVMREGVSRATLESMACGRPVIMTRLGDRRPVEHGRTGFLVEPAADSVLELLSEPVTDRDGLVEMGNRAHEIVAREYGVHAAMARQREIYETVLQSGGLAG